MNTETRNYAKKTYYLAFQNKLSNCRDGIYVDFERDVLCFNQTAALRCLYRVHTWNMNLNNITYIRVSISEPLPTSADDITTFPRLDRALEYGYNLPNVQFCGRGI